MEGKYEKLANLIFPDITETIKDLEIKYPERNLKEGAEVTRYAPSPTGFLHTGALFTSLINKKIADQTGGVFYLRLEDTDTKREVEGSAKDVLDGLEAYGLNPAEGLRKDGTGIGNYGPYRQSEREKIYKICAKELVRKGLAYPCFCTSEDLDKLRTMQEKEKIRPGYYGQFARCRNSSVDEMIERVERGDKYIVRLRSGGSHLKKTAYTDKIRGKIEQAQNDQDIVIIKSDNLPTYHFAHAVDDHFMRTTLVIRGEEWIASVPLHLELFYMLGFKPVKYAHVPTIMKLDGESKRKLSKRKDPEAACSYFLEAGYPTEAMIEYLLTIINSDFEPWRKQNEDKDISEFEVRLNKMNVAGALFDMAKVNDISKNIIGSMNTDKLFNEVKKWAIKYNKEVEELINKDEEYFKQIIGIERDNVVKVRKDFAKYEDILPNISYMYKDMFEKDVEQGYNFAENIDKSDVKQIIAKYMNIIDISVDKDTWFNNLKEFTDSIGFCSNMKKYKQNKEKYKGSIADVSGVIRVAVTNRQNTPDIYSIMNVLGIEEVKRRLRLAIDRM